MLCLHNIYVPAAKIKKFLCFVVFTLVLKWRCLPHVTKNMCVFTSVTEKWLFLLFLFFFSSSNLCFGGWFCVCGFGVCLFCFSGVGCGGGRGGSTCDIEIMLCLLLVFVSFLMGVFLWVFFLYLFSVFVILFWVCMYVCLLLLLLKHHEHFKWMQYFCAHSTNWYIIHSLSCCVSLYYFCLRILRADHQWLLWFSFSLDDLQSDAALDSGSGSPGKTVWD